MELRKIRKYYFTVNEMFIVLAVLSIIFTLLLPYAHRVANEYEESLCANSFQKTFRANSVYANDNGFYAPAAASPVKRWYGKKSKPGTDYTIDESSGPLFKYFSSGDFPKGCPLIKDYVRNPEHKAEEKGGHGCGYNVNIGSMRYISNKDFWLEEAGRTGVRKNAIKNPGETVMFTDTASRAAEDGFVDLNGSYVENAFCKSYNIINKGEIFWGSSIPTIHFRHTAEANAVWSDGHVTDEKMSFSKGKWGEYGLGFFGEANNKLFDLE